MSKPKPAIGSVKRRGLAIATAVAVAGGGFVPANYAFAQEETDPTQEELEREFGGTEADAIAQEAARKAYDALVAGNHDDVDKSLLEGLNEAAGLDGSGFSKEDLNAIGEEDLKYQIGELVDEEKHRYATANNNQGNSGESASEDETSQSAPTVQQVFDREKEAIKSLLKDSKSPEEAAQIVAGKVKSEIEVSKFNKFEYDLERLVKKYYGELIASGEIQLDADYALPSPETYFNSRDESIANELRSTNKPVEERINEIVDKHFAELEKAGFNFGDDRARTAWKSDLRELVEEQRKKAEDLAETKRAAVAAIEGAVYLTENQKSQFLDRINASAAVADVAAVVDQAHKLVDKQIAEEADKGTLAKDKGEAHRIIDRLNKLSLEQKAVFKQQVDAANTGAYVAHVVERAQEMNAQQNPSGDGAGAQEPGKPGSDNKPGQDQKPGSTTDTFKGFFGLAAGLGVFALIFGGILHTINHFDGFGVVQERVRNAFAKIGIRF